MPRRLELFGLVPRQRAPKAKRLGTQKTLFLAPKADFRSFFDWPKSLQAKRKRPLTDCFVSGLGWRRRELNPRPAIFPWELLRA